MRPHVFESELMTDLFSLLSSQRQALSWSSVVKRNVSSFSSVMYRVAELATRVLLVVKQALAPSLPRGFKVCR